ncbi:hypothetical protein ROZALSC1DRAFT_31064 [Rozella allomycis CSF55]|uniref:Uncharacterized protein n=1 Tax=Rozella allomycis (strain CSF55) TaxID=988480 RepID=A0A075B123_ROZAC|nr:hypothetical protein O9G_005206 [Rozella allomycis CSF55]RKP17096.1 hypothetical protein ROZALSC1DRAFT_31064 [Rozella allomycis CSF55]|eukprot:EPZ34636.1 hypothetical protein O9G_005206 [Rozella allomycis CSF55]
MVAGELRNRPSREAQYEKSGRVQSAKRLNEPTMERYSLKSESCSGVNGRSTEDVSLLYGVLVGASKTLNLVINDSEY